MNRSNPHFVALGNHENGSSINNFISTYIHVHLSELLFHVTSIPAADFEIIWVAQRFVYWFTTRKPLKTVVNGSVILLIGVDSCL
jgi:hypothetical protein